MLAPTFFYDNLTDVVLDRTATVLSLPLPADKPLQQLDRGTFGQIAASVLLAPKTWSGQRIELAADAPTGEQMAAALSRRGSRQVRYLRAGDVWRTGRVGHAGHVDLPARGRLPGRHPGAATPLPHVTWTSFAQWANATLHAAAATT